MNSFCFPLWNDFIPYLAEWNHYYIGIVFACKLLSILVRGKDVIHRPSRSVVIMGVVADRLPCRINWAPGFGSGRVRGGCVISGLYYYYFWPVIPLVFPGMASTRTYQSSTLGIYPLPWHGISPSPSLLILFDYFLAFLFLLVYNGVVYSMFLVLVGGCRDTDIPECTLTACKHSHGIYPMPCVILVLACINPLTNNDMGWFWPIIALVAVWTFKWVPGNAFPMEWFCKHFIFCRVPIDYWEISGHDPRSFFWEQKQDFPPFPGCVVRQPTFSVLVLVFVAAWFRMKYGVSILAYSGLMPDSVLWHHLRK